MNLSKAFDTFNHELLIAKLYTYGFLEESLQLIKSYLKGQSSMRVLAIELNFCQESVLGLLLFNIQINHLFQVTELTNICNCADDTTFYACDSDICNLIKRSAHDSLLAFEWFESNYMKLNENKCHFIISGYLFYWKKQDLGKKGKKSFLKLRSIKTLNLKNIF